jgi:hypothetical protein
MAVGVGDEVVIILNGLDRESSQSLQHLHIQSSLVDLLLFQFLSGDAVESILVDIAPIELLKLLLSRVVDSDD